MTVTTATSDAQRFKAAIKSNVKTWHSISCSTMQEAVDFVNYEPAQGAGEACFSFDPDGRIELMYFL